MIKRYHQTRKASCVKLVKAITRPERPPVSNLSRTLLLDQEGPMCQRLSGDVGPGLNGWSHANNGQQSEIVNVLSDGRCFSELLQCCCLAIGTIFRKYTK